MPTVVELDSAVAIDALEELRNAHLRIEQRLALLERLIEHMREGGPDERARRSCRAVVEYFDHFLPIHCADEELQLFPALVAATTRRERSIVTRLTGTLTLEHRAIEARWQAVRGPLVQLADGHVCELDAARIMEFESMCLRHMQDEDSEILARAERSLDERTLREIGKAMTRRRRAHGADSRATIAAGKRRLGQAE